MIRVTKPAGDYLPLVWAWLNEWRRNTIDDHSPQSFEQLVEKHRADQVSGGKGYLVLAGERPVGAVWFENMGDGIFSGHLVFTRRSVSMAETTEAVRQALATLFSNGARKVCWLFFADNVVFRRFLKRVGAVEEGHLRKHTRRGGEIVDMQLMASFPVETE